MLTYDRDPKGNFVITETIMGFSKTETKRVTYDINLNWKQVNNDPKLPLDEPSLEWFYKYYIPAFVRHEIKGSGYELVEGSNMGRGLFAFRSDEKQTVWFNHNDLLDSLREGDICSEIETCIALECK